MLGSLALFGTFTASVTFAGPQAADDSSVNPNTKTVTIPIKGMACQEMCGTRVAKALKAMDRVKKIGGERG